MSVIHAGFAAAFAISREVWSSLLSRLRGAGPRPTRLVGTLSTLYIAGLPRSPKGIRLAGAFNKPLDCGIHEAIALPHERPNSPVCQLD